MERTNTLTQLQRIALEGELARAYSTANHDSEILYRFYSMITKAPKDVKDLIVECTYELTEIDRDKIRRVFLESLVDTTPVWLWIDRTIEDLKLSLTLGSVEVEKVSLNKRLLRKKMIKSSFVYFCRNTAVISPSATIELCNAIIEREPLTLDFLADACFSMIRQVSELKMDTKVKAEIMDTPFDIRNILCFQTETEVLKEIVQESNKRRPLVFTNNFENIVSTGVSFEREDTSEQPQREYIVAKKYLDEDTTVMVKSFKTKEEATEFINIMRDKLPEMQHKFKFFIIGAKGGQNE